MAMNPRTELLTDEQTPGDLWRAYRDWFLVAAMLVGWGITYGELTTRLSNDEARIATQQTYLSQSVATRNDESQSRAELETRLGMMQTTLNTIQGEIFTMQEKGK